MKANAAPAVGYTEFDVRFIRWALRIAIFAGFALGAHVISVIGLNLSLGPGFYTYIQAHGHLQLVGWAGLFILGISLHFIPRLAGVPIARPQLVSVVRWCVVSGLVIRFVAHAFLPYLTRTPLFLSTSYLGVASGLLEWVGIGVYVFILLDTMRRGRHTASRQALSQVKPFFLMLLAGWLLYPGFNFALLLRAALEHAVTLNQPWNEFALQLFLHLVLLPVTFAFSIRMFPLYLRLPAVTWSVRGFALCYLAASALQLAGGFPPLAALPSRVPFVLASWGALLKGAVVLWFVWKLDLFTRRCPPWTVERKLEPAPGRRPTRPGMPDYGEFGRFERLVYAAYAWLLFAVVLEMALGLANLLGWHLPVSTDAVRHAYLLGFVTHLIFGMAVRMIPGFVHKKRVASVGLVDATFWLGTVAAVGRIVPLLIPVALGEWFPPLLVLVQMLLAFSGVFGMVAVICLAVNLSRTVKGEGASAATPNRAES